MIVINNNKVFVHSMGMDFRLDSLLLQITMLLDRVRYTYDIAIRRLARVEQWTGVSGI